MKDLLTYRITDDGEVNFNQAINAAKKWIGANISGPLKLTFSITLKASGVEGESVQEVASTDPLFDADGKPKRARRRTLEDAADLKE